MAKDNIDTLLQFGTKPKIDDFDKIIDTIEKINVDSETDAEKLKKAFTIAQYAIRTQNDQLDDLEENFQKEITALNRQILKTDATRPAGDRETRELEAEISRLESKNDQLRTELKDLELKLFNEQTDKEKLNLKLENTEKELNKYRKEATRLEDYVSELNQEIQKSRTDRYSKSTDENAVIQGKIKQKNKLIEELEDENQKLAEENQKLDELLQENRRNLEDAIFQMNKTTDEIKKLRLLQQESDNQIDQYRKEVEIQKSQIAHLNTQLLSQPNQDLAIISTFESRLKEYNEVFQQKDEEIRNLQELVISLKNNLDRLNVDSDKASVAVLTKAIQEKDKQIEVLKQQIEECTREMDKSSAVINSLNQNVLKSSRMPSGPGYISREAEQKIKYLERIIKDNEVRVRECEEQTIRKEKELNEALNRLNEYESGDYQLQQAVGEIKNLKNQVKIRDRDIETLTQHLNKVDYLLNEVLEENDTFRSKLGMEPREKINIDELKNLNAIKAQENRAFVHILKKEIESLEEERINLKEKIRKIAKAAAGKIDLATVIGEEFDLKGDATTNLITAKLNELDNKFSQMSFRSKGPNMEVDDLRKKNEGLLKLQIEYQNENKMLEQGLRELYNEMQNVKPNTTKGKEIVLKCPTLEKLLNIMETNKSSMAAFRNLALFNYTESAVDGNLNYGVLKSEIDYLQGRNEELRISMTEARNEATKFQFLYNKAQEELKTHLKNFNMVNPAEIFQPLKLPPGMSPSSKDIISALNEYLIDTLQELEEYKRVSAVVEKDLEKLKRKYSVQRHQLSLLYKQYIEENDAWKAEKENLLEQLRKVSNTIEDDSVKMQEYDRLLNTLEQDEVEIRRRLAENSRQMLVSRTTEKQLERKCNALQDYEVKLVKENKKLRTEIIQMEIAVQQRIGYLERYKDMSNFKILTYQRQIEESIPVIKLEEVNRKYDEVVENYRQLLDKQETHEAKTEFLQSLEEQNKKFSSEIEFLRKELTNEKERAHVLNEALEKMKAFSSATTPRYTSGKGGESDSSAISMSKRLIAIEMKELNERQRADYAQRMYDEQRNQLRQIENRNLELENNYAQLSKLYLTLQKTEQHLREELSKSVPKSVNDVDKKRITELEQNENNMKIEISRLKELTEITMYQVESLEFIHNLNKKELDCLGSIEVLAYDDDKTEVGKLHRQIISLQISEATAIRKLQNALQQAKKLESNLLRNEQKLDKEQQDSFYTRKEYTSKISYLRSTIQDLRHKYSGSIPLKQQERFIKSKQELLDNKKAIADKLRAIDDEKNDLEDKIAEYESRMQNLDILKGLNTTDTFKTNEKILEWHKKIENLKTSNLKLERANKRYKDEIKFLEDMNRKFEITIIQLEEDNVRMEKDFDQRVLIWEHREADLERQIEYLKQQHNYIENLALNFEEISGRMPDTSLSIPNQLEQAMHIIRDHLKLLAEAKVQGEIAKKRVDDLEEKLRKSEHEVLVRDKAISELRLRLPASADRDSLVDSAFNDRPVDFSAPARAAQSTIESLNSRLNQKEQTIIKYQELLKLSRDEISKLNKQHEIEINNLMEKLNTSRDTNLQKLKDNLKFTPRNNRIATKDELGRLQELEEVTVEQDNTISALNDKVSKLNAEIEGWKARYELLIQKFNTEKENMQREQQTSLDKLYQQIEEFKNKVKQQEQETQLIIVELENQKQQNSKSPTNSMKALVEKLKQQLAEKETQQQAITKALADLRSDMVNIAKHNLLSTVDEQDQLKQMMDKTTLSLKDKITSLEEEVVKLRKELKLRIKTNDDLGLENEHLNSQLKQKDLKLKKLQDENFKLVDDSKRLFSDKSGQALYSENKMNDNEYLRRQVRALEEKLKRQRPAEKPYDATSNSTQKFRDKIKALEMENGSLKDELKFAKQAIQTQTKLEKGESQTEHQLHQKYHFILNENTILKREKHDLEIENLALKRENDLKTNQLISENQMLKAELEKLKQLKTQGVTISKLTSNENLLSKISKLTEENLSLKKQLDSGSTDEPKNKTKLEELQKYVEFLKVENEKLRNNSDNPPSASSSTSTGLRRIGESGKSTRELEKTISLMKKIIVKLQQENEALKSSSLG